MKKRQEAVIEFLSELSRIPYEKLDLLINEPKQIKIVFNEYYPNYEIQLKECLEARIILKELLRRNIITSSGQDVDDYWDDNHND